MIPRIREVHLRNYRSIQQAVVRLSDFTVLVGPNGSGKSNFMDALAFVQEALATSLHAALISRGAFANLVYGVSESGGAGLGIRLVIELSSTTVADYAFELAPSGSWATRVSEERCVISEAGRERHRFTVVEGHFKESIEGLRPAIEPDRLALYAASSLPEFRPLYDFLTSMRLYSIEPDRVRDVGDPGPGLVLGRSGENAAAVMINLQENHPDRFERVQRLLSTVIPEIEVIGTLNVNGKQFLMFQGKTVDATFPLVPSNVSDGSLRMLGMLLAAYQASTPSVLLIEEPEATIHPAAVDVVMSVLLDAAKRSQVLLTTHSPDVLDYKSLPDHAIRVVTKAEHGTVIAPLAAASREAIRERLYTPGELLRTDELNPDVPAAVTLSEETQLFGDPVRSFEGAV